MWLRHWNLARDPFPGRPGPFVATPTHAEAAARLVHSIESGARSATLEAGPGLGKSTILARAIEATRGPGRRFARAVGPVDGANLFAQLAVDLGARLPADPGRAASWRALVDAVRLCRWQKIQVVLAVDSAEAIEGDAGRLDLDRLEAVDPGPAARLTVLRVGRPAGASADSADRADWSLPIRLAALTRGEAAAYLAARLAHAGLDRPAFEPRALARLHLHSCGIPRGIDRLAALAMMAAAVAGLELVPPGLVDGAAGEYRGDEPSRAFEGGEVGLVPALGPR